MSENYWQTDELLSSLIFLMLRFFYCILAVCGEGIDAAVMAGTVFPVFWRLTCDFLRYGKGEEVVRATTITINCKFNVDHR